MNNAQPWDITDGVGNTWRFSTPPSYACPLMSAIIELRDACDAYRAALNEEDRKIRMLKHWLSC